MSITEESYEKYFETQGESPLVEDSASQESEAANNADHNPNEEVPSEQHKDNDNAVMDSQDVNNDEEYERPQKSLEDISREMENYKKGLHSERMTRKDIQNKYDDLNRKYEDLVNKISQATSQDDANELERLKKENPTAYTEKRIEELTRKIQESEKKLQAYDQQTAQQQAMQTVVNHYQTAMEEYAREKPDLSDAYTYLYNNQLKNYMLSGYSQEEAYTRARADELEVVRNAFVNERNPGEFIYELAMNRGYSPKRSESTQNNKNVDKFNSLENGQTKSKSLSGAGGSVDNGMTIERLMELDGDEFSDAFDKFMVNT